ncbi:hypothetical protein [Brevifollis gellanilyticus]|uniref:Uncharacterized protein n=1 Tax=Brevifollis gellanilyticus TaxID=748831 RepID=A0A512MHX5_9BACT|nr:hypothetical protein [Brevifollis gellanilyticus]GEP46330.1 hypothetical protein BGE01nite_56210 [Brevifollis gellanilyticus]
MSEPADSTPPPPNTATKKLTRDTSRSTAREHIDDTQQPELRISVDKPKTTNHRQNRVGWPTFIIVQLLMLAFVISLVPRNSGTQAHTTAPVPVPAPAAVTVPAPASAPATSADTSGLEIKLSKAQDQISALQKQIDSQRGDRERMQATLQEMTDRMALVIKQNSFVPGGNGNAQNLSASDASQVAALIPTVTPATSELVLLKERNRLTDYADKAIATGSREGLQAIVETMFNQNSANMHHAAGAEFRRVAAYFEIASNIDPNYRLPIQELFKGKDSPVKAEADLKSDQLIKLMHDHQQPWEVRLRCAYLLRANPDAPVTPALLKTLHEDPSLDVVKQAQTSFEKRVGQRFRLFDLPSIDAWWATQTQTKK